MPFSWYTVGSTFVPRSYPFLNGDAGGAVHDGKLFVLGGPSRRDVNAYNPATDLWEPHTPLPTAQSFVFRNRVAADGTYLYLLSGVTLRRYNPTTGVWDTRATFPVSGADTSFPFVLHKGKIHHIGMAGFQHHAYDIATNTWSAALALPPTINNVPAAISVGDYIYVYGGPNTFVRYDPVTDTWVTLNSPVSGHWKTDLIFFQGAIWLMGGQTGDSFTTEVDIVESYDITTGNWTTLAPLPTRRTTMVSAVIGQRVYMVGGRENGTATLTKGLAIYSEDQPAPVSPPFPPITTNEWFHQTHAVFKPAALPVPGYDLGLVAHNGLIWRLGGNGAAISADVSSYDPATNTWTTRTPLDAATAITGNRVVTDGTYFYFFQGTSATFKRYDPATGVTMTLAAAPITNTLAPLIYWDGKIYSLSVTSSQNAIVYTIATNTWATFTLKPASMADASAMVIGDNFYIHGSGEVFQRYEPVHGFWRYLQPPPVSVRGSLMLAREGLIYLISGQTTTSLNTALRAEVQVYDPAKNQWAQAPALPVPRSLSAAALLGNNMYVAGGFVEPRDSFYTLDAALPTAKWFTTGDLKFVPAPLPVALYASGYVVHKGDFYLLGGDNGSAAIQSIWRYRPSTNSWVQRADLPAAMAGNTSFRKQVASDGTYIYFIDARNAVLYRFDTNANTFTALAPPGTTGSFDLLHLNGKLYYGMTSTNPRVYDIATNTWSGLTAAWTTIDEGATSAIFNGLLYFYSPTAFRTYNPTTAAWTVLTMPGVVLSDQVFAEFDGQLLLIGGLDADGTGSTNVTAYNPATGAWSAGLPMPTARVRHMLANVNGRVYVAGGVDYDATTLARRQVFTTEMYAYNPPVQILVYEFKLQGSYSIPYLTSLQGSYNLHFADEFFLFGEYQAGAEGARVIEFFGVYSSRAVEFHLPGIYSLDPYPEDDGGLYEAFEIFHIWVT